jgi:hypothetical protein
MFSVGETLKRARVAQGVDLCTLAARTKINLKYLEPMIAAVCRVASFTEASSISTPELCR